MDHNSTVLCLSGRIDSTNAAEFQKSISDATRQNPDGGLVLDCERLDYISSAGLRVLLAAHRLLGGRLGVQNVSPEVYDILNMTGFTAFLRVERRLRSVSVEGCEVIGRGATAVVYRLDPDTIVKVYEIPNALETIRKEQLRAKQAFLKGIPTAISYDAVRVGEYYGSVFELVNANTFSDLLCAHPERLDELVRRHAELIRIIHGTEAEPGELPDCRALYLGYLNEIGDVLPRELRERLGERFRAMPEDLHLIHGDIHMKNVMLCGGEALLIDMETLSTGNPVFDMADLFVAYRAFNEADPSNSMKIIGIPADTCREVLEKTIACCIGPLDGERGKLTMKKIMTVGYVRFLYLVAVLRFGGDEWIDLRIRRTVEHLNELIDEVDRFDL